MKQILLICAVVALVGCGTTSWVSDPSDPNNVKIEKAIRYQLKKPTGEIIKADLEKVTDLNLRDNKLTDVKGLENLTQLTMLALWVNQLSDVKGLEKLTKLEILYLSENQLTDVKGLEKLTQLRELLLASNQLTDVKGLEKLTQLKVLNLRKNPSLTKAQIDELQKALPKCLIRHTATK
jgi:Leucine-rich repeat (LRR) protein